MSDMHAQDPVLGQELFRLLVEYVEDYAIFAMDGDGCIVHWNNGAERTLGYATDEILGRHFETIFTEEDREQHVPAKELGLCSESGKSEDERWHVRKDGSRFWAVGLTVAIHDEQRSFRGFGKILRDRTDMKELQESLLQRAEQLDHADKNKDRLLATVAHELRNPLLPLQFCADLLRRHGGRHTELAPLADMVQRQISQVDRLINDLLDTSRISQGLLKLEMEDLDLRQVVSEAFGAMVEQRCHRHEVALSVPDSVVPIRGDAGRLRQVVTNLIDNACKYTPEGGSIAVELNHDDTQATLRVRDTGCGIAQDKMATLFEFFTQAHDSAAARRGLGIGLALAHNLVVRHGGTIQAFSSGVDKGSEFSIRLPLSVRGRGIR